jgi:hypothetical protein
MNGPWSALLNGAYKNKSDYHLKSFKCLHCSQRFSKSCYLTNHIKYKHPTYKPSKDFKLTFPSQSSGEKAAISSAKETIPEIGKDF